MTQNFLQFKDIFVLLYLLLITVSVVYLFVKIRKVYRVIKEFDDIDKRLERIDNVNKTIDYYFNTIMDANFRDDLVLKQFIKNASLDDDEIDNVVKDISVRIIHSIKPSERRVFINVLLLKDDDDFISYVTKNVRDKVITFIVESRK